MSVDEKQSVVYDEQVWEAIDKLRESHVETQKDLAGAVGVLRQVGEDLKALTSIVTRPPPRTNYTAVAMVILGIITVVGGYIQARLSPIEHAITTNASMHMERLRDLPDDYFQFGINKATLENHSKILERMGDALYKLVEDSQANQTAVKYLQTQVDAVDFKGSRVHGMSTGDVMDWIDRKQQGREQ
jgi:hypothetical protein